MQQPVISIPEYTGLIRREFERGGNPETAEQQMRYTRNQFSFYGLKAPEWMALVKPLYADHGIYAGDRLREFVRACFESEYREIHYAGLQMFEKRIRKLPPGDIDFLEECICTRSWWDTVDWVNKFAGIHLRRYPDLQTPTAKKWIASENIWLQRVAIIHQLTYKDETDFDLMCEMILRRSDSKEFFVQKAAGWALRQYSKTDAGAVTRFVDAHPELPALTKREGLKWLKRRGEK